MRHTIKVSSPDRLYDAACEFVEKIDPEKTIIAFRGEMGAGKTTFISRIVKALGVEDDNTSSPSFSIVNEYRSDTTAELIYHFDCYRLESLEEALDLGIEDYFDSGALCLIEWPERIEDVLPDDTLNVEITVDHETGERTITFDVPEE